MNASPGTRPPIEGELAVLKWLLGQSFKGAEALRAQMIGLKVAALDEWGSLRLHTQSGVPADTDKSVPIEANYADADGDIVHVLLDAPDGFLTELEVYKEDLQTPVIGLASAVDRLSLQPLWPH